MKQINNFFLFLAFIGGCGGLFCTEVSSIPINEKRKLALNVAQDSANLFKDSFNELWSLLYQNIRQRKIEDVSKVIDFPIRASVPVTFAFSCDCDTSKYIKNIEKYKNIEINDKNFGEYFDFIFSKDLMKILSASTSDKILKESVRYEDKNGILLTYIIFAKDHPQIKVKCRNDESIKVTFFLSSGTWKMGLWDPV